MSATDERRDMKRKLTTIFCADVSGYSRMMGADEARTLTTLKEYREAIEGFIARHHGRVVSWSGDGLLAEFASVVEAVQCAAEVQRELRARNASRDEHLRMTFRIGINLGDVMADGDDIFGEGVNIAARLQQMAVPGGILVSSPVYDQVRGKLSMGFAALGNQHVKNIAGEVSVYSVTMDGVTPHTAAQTVASVAPPRWREEEPAPEQPVRRARLFRRGLALVVDYCLVLFAVLLGALALNSTVDPNMVRMDLDVPFIDYGDMVDRDSWRQTSRSTDEDGVTIIKDERNVTYEYLGLFSQRYKQSRVRGTVPIDRKSKPSAPPAAPASAADPVPPVGAVPPPPPAPSPAPPPPPPPPSGSLVPSDPALAAGMSFTVNGRTVHLGPDGVDISDAADSEQDGALQIPAPAEGVRTFTADGQIVTIGPNGVDVRDAAAADADAAAAAADAEAGAGAGASISLGDDGDGFDIRFSYTTEQMLDPQTGKPIMRPSLDMLSLIFLILYFALMEMGRRGTTVGKNAFDLIVTREDGRQLGFGNALARNAIKVLTSFILPVAVLVVLVSRRRQGIHDRLAGTVVVENPNP